METFFLIHEKKVYIYMYTYGHINLGLAIFSLTPFHILWTTINSLYTHFHFSSLHLTTNVGQSK